MTAAAAADAAAGMTGSEHMALATKDKEQHETHTNKQESQSVAKIGSYLPTYCTHDIIIKLNAQLNFVVNSFAHVFMTLVAKKVQKKSKKEVWGNTPGIENMWVQQKGKAIAIRIIYMLLPFQAGNPTQTMHEESCHTFVSKKQIDISSLSSSNSFAPEKKTTSTQ